MNIQYEVGSARHKFALVAKGNDVTGLHEGWAYQGDLKGNMDGSRVRFYSLHPADGNTLSYTFTGETAGGTMSGDVNLGEYGRAKWNAQRHGA